MENEIKNIVQTYGMKHTRRFKPSVFTHFLSEHDDNNNLVKLHSDVYLLLHQKNIQRHIGVDAIRQYLTSMMCPSREMPDLSDDELMELIPPKDVNNLTTSYQYCKYLQEHSDAIKDNYKNKIKEHEAYSKMYEKLFGKTEKGE